jgi:hypothetical protein
VFVCNALAPTAVQFTCVFPDAALSPTAVQFAAVLDSSALFPTAVQLAVPRVPMIIELMNESPPMPAPPATINAPVVEDVDAVVFVVTIGPLVFEIVPVSPRNPPGPRSPRALNAAHPLSVVGSELVRSNARNTVPPNITRSPISYSRPAA